MGENHERQFTEMLERDRHLAAMVYDRVKAYGDETAFRHKRDGAWRAITWNELGRLMRSVSAALVDMGVKPGESVGIFSGNRPEWHVADLATLSVRGVTVPVYGTNSAREAEYIVRDAGISVLFAGNREQYEKALSCMGNGSPLRHIVVFDGDVAVDRERGAVNFDELVKPGRELSNGAELDARLASASYDDLATIIYTSGTTGDPKGVMLTHKNFFAMMYATGRYYQRPSKGGHSLCFLPLSHVFERAWSYGVMQYGMINSYCPDPKLILEYFAEARPMYMTSVPRLWEKIYATIFERLQAASPRKKRLFMWAVETGKRHRSLRDAGARVPAGLALRHFFADRLVLRKLRAVVGGRPVSYNVGGAAFSAEINEFFNGVGITLAQGYGLTEAFPISVSSPEVGIRYGACGRIVPLMQVRISDEGEIQVKGPAVMSGYYNKPEATAAVFTRDGWFKTGDVGHVDSDGYVRITERIKDLIITSGGKNIAPQQIETLVGEDLYIEQIAVIGDGRNYISALVVPSFEALEPYARSAGIPFERPGDLIDRPEIIEFYRQRIEERTRDLGQVEKIKRFTLMAVPFSQENGEITPTMKIKRKVIEKKYGDVIDTMYRGA